jgi:hypothetical protein
VDEMRPHIRTILDEILLFKEYPSMVRPVLSDPLL